MLPTRRPVRFTGSRREIVFAGRLGELWRRSTCPPVAAERKRNCERRVIRTALRSVRTRQRRALTVSSAVASRKKKVSRSFENGNPRALYFARRPRHCATRTVHACSARLKQKRLGETSFTRPGGPRAKTMAVMTKNFLLSLGYVLNPFSLARSARLGAARGPLCASPSVPSRTGLAVL